VMRATHDQMAMGEEEAAENEMRANGNEKRRV
jgi:hypothetical protein